MVSTPLVLQPSFDFSAELMGQFHWKMSPLFSVNFSNVSLLLKDESRAPEWPLWSVLASSQPYTCLFLPKLWDTSRAFCGLLSPIQFFPRCGFSDELVLWTAGHLWCVSDGALCSAHEGEQNLLDSSSRWRMMEFETTSKHSEKTSESENVLKIPKGQKIFKTGR